MAEYESAIADYSEAIRLKLAMPDLVYAYYGRGSAYAVRHNWDKAVADFTEAVRIDPEFSGAYHYRALVYKEMGENQKAKADLKRATELGYGKYGGQGQPAKPDEAKRRTDGDRESETGDWCWAQVNRRTKGVGF